MNITSAQYLQSELESSVSTIKATIDGVHFFVPIDPTNRHYAAILEWVADGNTIQEAD
tara:strand:+ start:472 stop:645 length:174 start_codon:yes stop_codon:yes gene_type:complete